MRWIDKEKKKIRFTTNNKSIYQKNLHYGYIQNKVIRKYFGYINISPHENTIKHEKINKGFDFSMASDKFRASEFDKYLEESKNELTTTQDIKLKQLLNEVKEFVFINTNNHKYSSGEKAMLYYLTCIYIMLEINSNLIVYIDEVELFLHPMWQKRAIKIFIESLKNKITKNKVENKKIVKTNNKVAKNKNTKLQKIAKVNKNQKSENNYSKT